MKEIVINLGGEGKISGAIDVNNPLILDKRWRCSRNGRPLKEVKQGCMVVCCGDRLPFRNHCADKIIKNSIPIDTKTWMGPGYSSKEIERINKRGRKN